MQNYMQASEKLAGRKSRKIGNNTYLEQNPDGTIAVRLHHTQVVTYYQSGLVRLNNGGWRTVTTKARMNEYAPVRIYQRNHEWYVRYSDGSEEEYFNGMCVCDTADWAKNHKAIHAAVRMRMAAGLHNSVSEAYDYCADTMIHNISR